VTVYPVTGDPPKPEAFHETVADVVAATAMTPVGVPGTVEGVAPAEGVEELPFTLDAVTLNE